MENEYDLPFHKRLTSLREYHGMSKKEVSVRLDLAYTTYTNYEYGTREPDFDTLTKLAAFFEVSTDFLLGVLPLSPEVQNTVEGLMLNKDAWLLEIAKSPDTKYKAMKNIWNEVREL